MFKKAGVLILGFSLVLLIVACSKSSGIKDFTGKYGLYNVSYDQSSWTKTDNLNPTAELQLVNVKGDAYAMVISERAPIPLNTLKDIALENAKKAAQDMKIVSEEKINIDGKDALAMRMDGTVEGTEISYYGYYFSNEKGTIQFITFTSKELFESFKPDFEKLLKSLKILSGTVAQVNNEADSQLPKTEYSSKLGQYTINYSSNREGTSPLNEVSELSLIHKDGDIYAMIIAETGSMTIDALRDTAISNAKSASSDIKVLYEDKVSINGKEMLVLKMGGTINGIEFVYYGYYYAGKEGTIQFITYTFKNLFDQYKGQMKELMESIKIVTR